MIFMTCVCGSDYGWDYGTYGTICMDCAYYLDAQESIENAWNLLAEIREAEWSELVDRNNREYNLSVDSDDRW